MATNNMTDNAYVGTLINYESLFPGFGAFLRRNSS